MQNILLMKTVKAILLTFCLFLTFLPAFSGPAFPMKKTVSQSDGASLTVIKCGDESFHYFGTLDGIPVLQVSAGDWYYGMFNASHDLVTSGILAHNKENRSLMEQSMAEGYKKSFHSYLSQPKILHKYTVGVVTGASIKHAGVVHIPVVLVQFSDVKFSSAGTSSFFQEHFNGSNYTSQGGFGSVRDYFIAQSDSAFQPVFDIIGPVTLSRSAYYYGQNGGDGEDLYDITMMNEALDSAVSAGYDFTAYASNANVPCVSFIYAGEGEHVNGPDNTIWAKYTYWLDHKTSGLTFNCGLCTCEMADYTGSGDKEDGIGTYCHELSHAMGLPDFYSTGSDANVFGLDYWDVMDWGQYINSGCSPVGYSAYEREFMNWLKVDTLQPVKQLVNIQPISGRSGKRAYRILNHADQTGGEYLLLQNRRGTQWYSSYYGRGMMIYHVDYLRTAWTSNIVNSVTDHQRMTIIPADGKLTCYVTTDGGSVASYATQQDYMGDLYPGYTGNAEFSDTSVPKDTAYTGGSFHCSMKQIKYQSDGSISFYYMCDGELDAPASLVSTQEGETNLKFSWDGVMHAAAYKVVLTDADGEVFTDTLTATDASFTGLTANRSYTLNVTAIADSYLDSPVSSLTASTQPLGIKSVKNEWGSAKVKIFSMSGSYYGEKILNDWLQSGSFETGIYILKKENETKKVFIKKID